MKHFWTFLLIIIGGTSGFCQSFELVDRQENYLIGTGQSLNIPLKIRNTADKAQFYVFRKVQDDLNSAQKGYFCLDKNCLEPDAEEFSRRIESGETLQNLNFTIETGLLSGSHFIKFEIFPRGYPGLAIEHTVTLSIDDRGARARIFNSKEISVNELYPNPITDQAVIEYSIHSELVKAKVVIHNILGKFLGEYELPVSENKIKIQAEDLPAGVYFYTLYLNNQGVLTRKLIVRK